VNAYNIFRGRMRTSGRGRSELKYFNGVVLTKLRWKREGPKATGISEKLYWMRHVRFKFATGRSIVTSFVVAVMRGGY
jgi:hypothetical protein